jgi:hypothetical protein
MKFVHDDRDFAQLLGIVARDTGVAAALVEKQLLGHALLVGPAPERARALVQRRHQPVQGVRRHSALLRGPRPDGPARVGAEPAAGRQLDEHQQGAERRSFYGSLPNAFAIPAVKVEVDEHRSDKYARGADFIGRYPGVLLDRLAPSMSPFVRFEVGRARVVPFVEMPLTSFVHDALARQGQLADYVDNRPRAVRCVHPLVTLLEKLDALARRYARDGMEPDSFVRHYEDAAHSIRAASRLPAIQQTARELADEMLQQKDITSLPRADEPALLLADATRRAEVMRAYERIAPMFWGARIPLDEACATVIGWVANMRR